MPTEENNPRLLTSAEMEEIRVVLMHGGVELGAETLCNYARTLIYDTIARQQRVDNLQDVIASAGTDRKRLDEANDTIQSLMKGRQELANQVVDLKAHLENHNAHKQRDNAGIVSMQAEVTKLTSQLGDAERANTTLTNQVAAEFAASRGLFGVVAPIIQPLLLWAQQLGPQAINTPYRFSPQALSNIQAAGPTIANFQRPREDYKPRAQHLTEEQSYRQFYGEDRNTKKTTPSPSGF